MKAVLQYGFIIFFFAVASANASTKILGCSFSGSHNINHGSGIYKMPKIQNRQYHVDSASNKLVEIGNTTGQMTHSLYTPGVLMKDIVVLEKDGIIERIDEVIMLVKLGKEILSPGYMISEALDRSFAKGECETFKNEDDHQVIFCERTSDRTVEKLEINRVNGKYVSVGFSHVPNDIEAAYWSNRGICLPYQKNSQNLF